jgi:predicted nucleic acid-binding protein
MVGNCEPETARRFGSGTSRLRRARSDIDCVIHQQKDGLEFERDGVTIARHRGLKVVGTLAALDLAAAHGLIDLQTMFDRLRATTFRSPVRLMVSMLEQDAERKKRQ